MSLDTLLRRCDTYLRTARKRLPRLRRLPYLVVTSPLLESETDHKVWRAFEQGELETSDLTGYAEHNAAHLEVARAMRIVPKVYAFDADAEHEIGVQEHARDVAQDVRGAETATTSSVYAEYTKRDGTIGRMEMHEDT